MKIYCKFCMKSYLKFCSILVVGAFWNQPPGGRKGTPPSLGWVFPLGPGAGELLPSQFASQVDVRTVKNSKMSSKRRTDLKI